LAERSGANVQSVERAIAILQSFSIEKPERGVGELSRELGLHKSTVSRLMTTLERGGLLSRDPQTQRYRLGIELIGLASQVVSYMDVREVARPVLRQFAEECQESVNLVVLDVPSSLSLRVSQSGNARPGLWAAVQVVNLDQFVPPARQIKNIGRVGRRMCAHSTAAGKVLLADLAPGELDAILPDELERFTPGTITDPKNLCRELVSVREQGYAVVQEELEEGLNAIAAPVYDHTGRMAAAVSVAGPAYRVAPESFPRLAARLMDITAQISRQLGYLPRRLDHL
jgi:DNA-binding IclR family transcriptional regulator